jgi:hypothetical protein
MTLQEFSDIANKLAQDCENQPVGKRAAILRRIGDHFQKNGKPFFGDSYRLLAQSWYDSALWAEGQYGG